MDSHLESYLEQISNTLYRIANTLEELVELNKKPEPETDDPQKLEALTIQDTYG